MKAKTPKGEIAKEAEEQKERKKGLEHPDEQKRGKQN